MTQLISKVLFTTDMSDNSTHAFGHAISLVKAMNARLHVLHVTEPLSDEARITMQMFMQNKSMRDEALKSRRDHVKLELEERHKNFWSSLPESDRLIREQVDSVEVIEGHPAEVILRRSKELSCNLIILGAHSHGFTHTFLGSVAKRVLRRATIPTLVVPYLGPG